MSNDIEDMIGHASVTSSLVTSSGKYCSKYKHMRDVFMTASPRHDRTYGYGAGVGTSR
ncbi:hypothetical protein HETIRDRAFT_415789 [Heterobasidion irregulare TC 32-1]|uniref:Uncharacterized protein n=1 Tax=Heterobasidion irregulare (strain TC 32-1) TaxID=747525 RepID=W4KEA5_HETIT|nr:uncharacterized protein HETIRDRAFT_415789 [Heterobasidion irregulare TC 32-1]ETW84074.1 hypothetical protein HETIRDRAFT_415789 [Heterobasidion irregulare TC 32-1]